MSCGCGGYKDGKAIVDHLKSKKKESHVPAIVHEIICECGETFLLEKVITNCPKCEMTYAVTPCSSSNKENIKTAGRNYA